MENLNAFWIILGIAILVFGPAGGVWAGMRANVKASGQRTEDLVAGIGDKISSLEDQVMQDRADTREWLKSLQRKTDQNETAIAVLKDRTERPA